MLKFNDYKYERPNIKSLEEKFNDLLNKFDNADAFDLQNEVIKKINELRNEYECMENLVLIRHYLNTTDEFYNKEREFINNNSPIYEGLVSKYYKSLLNSKYKFQLEEKWGKQLFNVAELKMRTFSNEIVKDLQKENELADEYMKIMAQAEVMFDGEKINLVQIRPFMRSTDRDIRKKAHEVHTSFFEENEKKLADLFSDLVKVRDKIAKKLGFENFIDLGYSRMTRVGYNEEMVANFRKQVIDYVVPISEKLRKKQTKRIGVDGLKYYDEGILFLSGNANPKGNSEFIVENSKKMYSEMSQETKAFFTYMVDCELLDLLDKKNKAKIGFCTYIPKYKSPFIYSNFTGSLFDINVITHEAGHAFQKYISNDFEIPEYINPTKESAEIYSMTMEYFTWQWMNLFFKEDTDKYKLWLLNTAFIDYISYATMIDEFQHWVYKNPDVTCEERKMAYREIEKKYMPYKDYEDNDFLNNGGDWYKLLHIFKYPFYIIDYSLAEICALQLFVKFREDREKAWNDYLTLCKVAGSKSFIDLLKLADLKNPFEEGCVESVTKPIEEIINSIDDTKF